MNTPPHAFPTVGTSDGLWLLDPKRQVEFKGQRIDALQANPDALWAIVDHHSLYRRDLDGAWKEVASTEDLGLTCLLSFDGSVLAGTTGADLLRLAGAHLEKMEGFETAEGRKTWYTPWGGPPAVRSLTAEHSGTLYVNVHVGGILRSRDDGKSWQQTIDIHADVHEVKTIVDRPGLLVAATARGLAFSLDGGDSWRFDRDHLHATYCRAVGVCENMLLLTASTGPRGGRAAIYRRELDKPGTFEKCTQGLPEWFSDNIDTGCLATSGPHAAFGTGDGQVFISQDAGATWERSASGLPTVQAIVLEGAYKIEQSAHK